MRSRFLVWGAGAIGGTLGAYLVLDGADVTMVDTCLEHVTAIVHDGLRITGPIDDFVVGVPAFTPQTLGGAWDEIILATKAHHTDLAVRRRPTEFDAQLGIVVTLGAEAGVPTPLTARLVTLIHDIERGARPQSLDTLEALAATPHTVPS